MRKHEWALTWPGNFCKRCGCDDPMEQCMADCKQCPVDEQGWPDPGKCPEHMKDEYWDCPLGDA